LRDALPSPMSSELIMPNAFGWFCAHAHGF